MWTELQQETDFDDGRRLELFAVDGDDGERIRQAKHIALDERVGRDDWRVGTRESAATSRECQSGRAGDGLCSLTMPGVRPRSQRSTRFEPSLQGLRR